MEYDIILLNKKGDNRVNMDNEIKLTDGFIDLKINENLLGFRNVHQKEYAIIRETKTLLDSMQREFINQDASKSEMYLVTAIIELNKLFQSAVVLFERGLLESGNIIIRSCLELSFKIVEIIKNKNFVDDMIKELNHETITTLNIIKSNKLYDIVPKLEVKRMLSIYNTAGTKPKISPFKLEKKNDLMREYILYRLYCNDSHQSIATLSEIQIFEDNGVRLNGNLRLDKFSESVYMLISIIMIPFPTLIDEVFTDDKVKEQYEKLKENFQNVFEKE